jgi:beta-phosphoglucomutase-like phosphatase (HAD superfamily)
MPHRSPYAPFSSISTARCSIPSSICTPLPTPCCATSGASRGFGRGDPQLCRARHSQSRQARAGRHRWKPPTTRRRPGRRRWPASGTLRTENGRNAILFPGVIEGLEAFKAIGLPLGVITNKAEAFTLPLLERTGLAPIST